jgi:hypothetical protein
MNSSVIKKFLPHLLAVAFFLSLTMVYFSPIFKGKELKRHDYSVYTSIANEANEFKKETGETTLWTNSLFGGMPTYLNTPIRDKVFGHVHRILTVWKNENLSQVFLYLLGFYLALLVFGVRPWLAVAGAVAFTFSSYLFIIIQAGHGTKAFALGYMAPILAGVYLAFNKKPILGSLLMAIFLTLQIRVNHFQITYYTLIAVLVFGIIWLYKAYKENAWAEFGKSFLFSLAGVLLAIGVNITSIYTTYEYGNYSIRGPSELSHNETNQTSGLDKDYATSWSYGIDETLTLLIPNFKGGASGGSLSEDSEMYRLFEQAQGKGAAKKVIKQLPLYFGTQPVTSGPVYVGAIVCFLFVLGIFILRGPMRSWLIAITVISIVLSWGRNLMTGDLLLYGLIIAGLIVALKSIYAKADKKAQKRYLIIAGILVVAGFVIAVVLPESIYNNPFSYYVLDYFPGYNKFRTVSMTLVIAGFAMPLMAILAVVKALSGEIEKAQFTKFLYWSTGITAGLSLLIGLFSSAFNYTAPSDAGMQDMIATALQSDREMLLKSDAFRSFGFIIAAALLLWLVYHKKIKPIYFYPALITLLLFDMWPINKRYLNDDHFVTKKQFTESFNPTQADQYILKDSDKDFRVLNLSVSTFNDATTSHYHKSIGGYHGAKMRRYQELIDFHLFTEMQAIIKNLQQPNQTDFYGAVSGQPVLNMLNTKYIIISPENFPIYNSGALGSVWFVNSTKLVDNADQEIAALGSFNPKEEAIVDKRFATLIQPQTSEIDTTATIKLNVYKPNYLKYSSKSNTPRVAVFSEIYYPKGWNATIDGKPADYFRANYVLRAMVVPQGVHEIEWRFEPKAYKIGNTVSYASSFILLFLCLGLFIQWIQKERKGVN